jgi:hypothetical protein
MASETGKEFEQVSAEELAEKAYDMVGGLEGPTVRHEDYMQAQVLATLALYKTLAHGCVTVR